MSEREFEQDVTAIRGAESETPTLVRHEEEAWAEAQPVQAGVVRVHKRVETGRFEEVIPRGIEYGDLEREGPMENDTGEIVTLPDGSVSIPLLEEEIVVTKRTVVRERVIVRKRTVTEEHTVEAAVRRERVEIESSDGAPVEDERA